VIHALKSRFIPYLNAIEQPASSPFAFPSPPHTFQFRKFSAESGVTMLGMSAGSTITAPCALSTAIASAITFFCASFRNPRGVVLPPTLALS
jgi:hypothetical protein